MFLKGPLHCTSSPFLAKFVCLETVGAKWKTKKKRLRKLHSVQVESKGRLSIQQEILSMNTLLLITIKLLRK